MKSPRLIQRCKFKEHKGPVGGIDEVLSYDYQGNSYFEWGMLNKSLRRMVSYVDELIVVPVNYCHNDGRGLFIICKSEDIGTVKEFVNELSKSNSPKNWFIEEPPHFHDVLVSNGKPSYVSSFDAFWDIENDYFFGFGKKNCSKIIKGIKAYRNRIAAKQA